MRSNALFIYSLIHFDFKKCMGPVLKLEDEPIQFEKQAKFLGLIWNTKLTFESHIKYLRARRKKSLNKSCLVQNGVQIEMIYQNDIGSQ